MANSGCLMPETAPSIKCKGLRALLEKSRNYSSRICMVIILLVFRVRYSCNHECVWPGLTFIVGVICSIAAAVRMKQVPKIPGEPDLEIYGPPGIRDYVRFSLSSTASHIASDGFSLAVHELLNANSKQPVSSVRDNYEISCNVAFDLLPLQKFGTSADRVIPPDSNGIYHLVDSPIADVYAAPLKHRVPTFGYVIKEKPKLGALNMDKVTEAGIPTGRILGKIKQATSPVTLPDGRVIDPKDFVDPPSEGRSVGSFSLASMN